MKKALEVIEALTPLLEMANISNRDHKLGAKIKINIVQKTDKIPSHFARAKVIYGNQELYYITLPDLKVSQITQDMPITKAEINKINAWVKKNKNGLLELYNDPLKAIDDVSWIS